MIKKLIVVLFVFSSSVAFGQLIERPLKSYKKSRNRIAAVKDTTLILPFWDDFSGVETTPNPLLWSSSVHVGVSSTIGINVPTINVAVLNGTDSVGIPYDLDENLVSAVDSLVSHKIDLTRVPVGQEESVFMSFFWQASGRGEIPDSEDYLRLSFLNAEGAWETQDIDGVEGGVKELFGGPEVIRFDPDNIERQIFTQVILKVDRRFFHEAFQFRFQSFGSKKGSFDSWLVDYVYLNYNRNINDTVYDDRAISMDLDLSVFNYQTVPYEHLFNNKDDYSENLLFEVNSLDTRIQPLNYWIELYNNETDEFLGFIDENNETGNVLLIRKPVRSLNPIDGNLIISESDTASIRLKTYIKSDDAPLIPNAKSFYSFLSNDTIYDEISFKNHYAYDDGSAEFAAGINVDGGIIVVKYGVLSRDTLTQIDINFPVLTPDSERERLKVMVLKDLTGTPESILSFNTVRILKRDSTDEFSSFRLRFLEGLIVEDSFFIGFQQFTNDFVPIGLDKNTDNGDKIFVNLGDNWEKNVTLKGSLMIRPVFGQSEVITSSSSDLANEVKLYPNPVSNTLFIEGKYEEIALFNISGQSIPIVKNADSSIDVSSLKSGLYVLKLKVKENYKVLKFIRE